MRAQRGLSVAAHGAPFCGTQLAEICGVDDHGFETKPVYYEVVHGATLRVRVFTGVTSDSRAHLECIVTYHGDPEAPELRT